jgi:hypothetical protein
MAMRPIAGCDSPPTLLPRCLTGGCSPSASARRPTRTVHGSADLQYVWVAVLSIGEHMTDDKVIVDRSTVPVGTADRVRAVVLEVLAERVDADIERVPHGLPLRILFPREKRTAWLTSHEPSQPPPALRLSLSPGCQDAGLQRPR